MHCNASTIRSSSEVERFERLMAEVSDPADHYDRRRVKKEFGPSEQQLENEGLDGNTDGRKI